MYTRWNKLGKGDRFGRKTGCFRYATWNLTRPSSRSRLLHTLIGASYVLSHMTYQLLKSPLIDFLDKVTHSGRNMQKVIRKQSVNIHFSSSNFYETSFVRPNMEDTDKLFQSSNIFVSPPSCTLRQCDQRTKRLRWLGLRYVLQVVVIHSNASMCAGCLPLNVYASSSKMYDLCFK